MKQRIVIFANGDLHPQFLRELTQNDFIVGVDKAAYWLISHGIPVHLAIGDFDSVTVKERTSIKHKAYKIEEYPAEKDWTDLELAVKRTIQKKPTGVTIFGGTGTRIDHTLAAVHCLEMLLTAKIPHYFMNKTNRVRLVGPGRTILFPTRGYRYVSIIPHSNAITLTLSGFKYDLRKTRLVRGTTRGVSNELSAKQGVIELFAGKAWLIESRD